MSDESSNVLENIDSSQQEAGEHASVAEDESKAPVGGSDPAGVSLPDDCTI